MSTGALLKKMSIFSASLTAGWPQERCREAIEEPQAQEVPPGGAGSCCLGSKPQISPKC